MSDRRKDDGASPQKEGWGQRHEPYVGSVESLFLKLFVDKDDSNAVGRRRRIHRLWIAACVILAIGGLVILAMMILALIGSFSF
jgi:hypothetical protein